MFVCLNMEDVHEKALFAAVAMTTVAFAAPATAQFGVGAGQADWRASWSGWCGGGPSIWVGPPRSLGSFISRLRL